jgi:hypothetical protein
VGPDFATNPAGTLTDEICRVWPPVFATVIVAGELSVPRRTSPNPIGVVGVTLAWTGCGVPVPVSVIVWTVPSSLEIETTQLTCAATVGWNVAWNM